MKQSKIKVTKERKEQCNNYILNIIKRFDGSYLLARTQELIVSLNNACLIMGLF